MIGMYAKIKSMIVMMMPRTLMKIETIIYCQAKKRTKELSGFNNKKKDARNDAGQVTEKSGYVVFEVDLVRPFTFRTLMRFTLDDFLFVFILLYFSPH